MTAMACSASDIWQINETKEYTFTSTYLLEKILTDNNLSAQAAKLWQLLFNQAKYDKDLKVKISYQKLALKFGKSIRTIHRYVNDLTENGYLTIENNYFSNGSNDHNTFSVRFPIKIIKEANKTKNRIKVKDKGDDLQDQSSTDRIKQKSKKINIFKKDSVVSIFKENTSGMNDEIDPNLELTSNDNNDIRGDDINVIQKNINIKDNTNNNRGSTLEPGIASKQKSENETIDVVYFLNDKDTERNTEQSSDHFSGKKQNEIIQIKQKIAFVNKMIVTEEEKLKTYKLGTEQHYEQNRLIGNLKTETILLSYELERAEKAVAESNSKQQKKNEAANNIEFIHSRVGERTMPTQTFQRLVNTLKRYGHRDNQLIWLVNEIVYEIRFGSLVSNNNTKELLTCDNAVNIALKLVREKRWTSPSVFKNYFN